MFGTSGVTTRVQVRRTEDIGMLSKRFSAVLATGFWVAGALLVGQAIHRSVVSGELAVTAPGTVIPAVFGVLLLLVGRRLDVHPSEFLEYVGEEADERGADGVNRGDGQADAAEFDPELSPLGEEGVAALEERERREDEENRQA